ncbi:MAG: hypothetical protein JNJ53_13520, partial [Rhizobiales bacterium]|nr:hypothetical protein [Hyphomicrobiales bacterium]
MFHNSPHSLEPAMIETLATAFDMACARFAIDHGGCIPNETMRNAIAQRMINGAGEGELDIERIIASGLRGTWRTAA